MDFRDLRDFGDLEPGRRALDRSEAGRRAPGEDFDRFSMDFHQPRQRNHSKFLPQDENLLILMDFVEFQRFQRFRKVLPARKWCPEKLTQLDSIWFRLEMDLSIKGTREVVARK